MNSAKTLSTWNVRLKVSAWCVIYYYVVAGTFVDSLDYTGRPLRVCRPQVENHWHIPCSTTFCHSRALQASPVLLAGQAHSISRWSANGWRVIGQGRLRLRWCSCRQPATGCLGCGGSASSPPRSSPSQRPPPSIATW